MVINSFRLFLIIIMGLILLALLIILIVYLIRRLKKPKNLNNNDITYRPNSISSIVPTSTMQNSYISPFQISHNNDNNIEKKNKKDYLSKDLKINAFCECFLKPIKFSSIKVYNESCPIDLIPFNENDEISVTKCFHGFHFNCIKKYLLENDTHNEFKCPICLTPLFEINMKV